MKTACEVCGSPLHASPNRVEIDGAVMVVCNNCARLGKQRGTAPAKIRFNPVQGAPARTHFNPVQGALRTMAQRPIEPEYEVDPDYNLKIKQAREKLGL